MAIGTADETQDLPTRGSFQATDQKRVHRLVVIVIDDLFDFRSPGALQLGPGKTPYEYWAFLNHYVSNDMYLIGS